MARPARRDHVVRAAAAGRNESIGLGFRIKYFYLLLLSEPIPPTQGGGACSPIESTNFFPFEENISDFYKYFINFQDD